MSGTRWGSWGDMVSLRDAMDGLLQEGFVRQGGPGGAMALPLDVEERGDEFVVTAPIPGIAPEQVEITVLGDRVRIRAERREERRQGGEGQRWLMREQRYGLFERTVTLPCAVNAGRAEAEFRDGVLTVTLPKAEEARERRIPIRSGRQGGQPGQEQEVPIGSGGQPGQGGRS